MLRRIEPNTMHFTLRQHRLRWLGQIVKMGDERISKCLMYSELVDGRRKRVWTTLRFKDADKRDLTSLNVDTDKWGNMLMTATHCDFPYTEVLKKEKTIL